MTKFSRQAHKINRPEAISPEALNLRANSTSGYLRRIRLPDSRGRETAA